MMEAKVKRLNEIENYMEYSAAKFERNAKSEVIRERRRLYLIVIKLNVGIIAILCAVYAIYMQF